MQAMRPVSAGAVAAILLLGSATVVLGQDGAGSDGQHYVFGEVEGYLHPDEDNPLGCDVGFTSDNTLYGDIEPFGPTTVRQLNCFVPTVTLDNIQLADVTYTTADGDTLTAYGSGDCIPDEVSEPGAFYSCWVVTTITGGTGKYEGASGEIHALAYTLNEQSDHPEAAPGDVPISGMFEGLVEY